MRQRQKRAEQRFMEDCIFCAIVEGKAPSFRVYEDDSAIAFLDINPAVEGHTLVIPRKHARDLWEISEDEAAATMIASVRVAGQLRRALKPAGINIVHATGAVAFQSVFHFHLHLIPRNAGDPIKPPWSLHERSFGFDRNALQELAEKIRGAR
ncbi:MAG: HIT family protein [Actinomycetota bacterium]